MQPKSIAVHTGLLFDPKAKAFGENASVIFDVETGAIADVFERDNSDKCISNGDIDLRSKVAMPGFVDAHTHIFLHLYEERPAQEQMRDESIVERTIRATNHVRRALLSVVRCKPWGRY
ncbi:hypothetical protein TOPH_05467 [Tolypocladium ophioglossoides CBS 100239]|uniref:Amidohydrolase-related domain-containing protein n=1 Tax=Tolypocladium ophioglossoides (strain CBS 100239) TaxID=1163406 RepID=A0A0L0N7L9_TOLOC|nr:hypothetical protein TOPH_05467 [Tolypocladium ophioglossoides CBS 100239]